MKNNNPKMFRRNASLVDILFAVVFETLWMPPYDQRRNASVMREFEQNFRCMAVLLGDTDLRCASDSRRQELLQTGERLAAEIETMRRERVFPDEKCTEAALSIGRLNSEIEECCRQTAAV